MNLKLFVKVFMKIEDTSIFTWSSIPYVQHYRWLCGPIRRLPPNNKGDYLVHIIQRTLFFCNYELSLWHSLRFNM
jgi:hypothetical protein